MSTSEVFEVLMSILNDLDVVRLISEFSAPLQIALHTIDWSVLCWMVTSECHMEPFQKEFQKNRQRIEDQAIEHKLRDPTLKLFEEVKDSICSWERNRELEASIAQEFKEDANGGRLHAFVEAFQPESLKLREEGYGLIAIGIDRDRFIDIALVLTKEDRYVIITRESGDLHIITPEFNHMHTHGSSRKLYDASDNVARYAVRAENGASYNKYVQDEWNPEDTQRIIQQIFDSIAKHFTLHCDQSCDV
jgi:hypothetical protein